jgi:hypothetical protein
MFAKASVDTDRIERKAALLSDQISSFIIVLYLFHNTADRSAPREISPMAENV